MNLLNNKDREANIAKMQVGDSFWFCGAEVQGRNSRFRLNVKPCLVTVAEKRNYGTPEKPKYHLTWDFSQAPQILKMRRGVNITGLNSLLTLEEEDSVNLYDARITELANNCGSYARKQRMLLNCMATHPGEDTLANDARTWQDGLTDLERTYIKKLIELTT